MYRFWSELLWRLSLLLVSSAEMAFRAGILRYSTWCLSFSQYLGIQPPREVCSDSKMTGFAYREIYVGSLIRFSDVVFPDPLTGPRGVGVRGPFNNTTK